VASLPNLAVYKNKAAPPAAPLARRQRRALPWKARPAHAGTRSRGQRRSAWLIRLGGGPRSSLPPQL